MGHAVRVPLVAADALGLCPVGEQRGRPAVGPRGALRDRAHHRQRHPEKGNSPRTSPLLSWSLTVSLPCSSPGDSNILSVCPHSSLGTSRTSCRPEHLHSDLKNIMLR